MHIEKKKAWKWADNYEKLAECNQTNTAAAAILYRRYSIKIVTNQPAILAPWFMYSFRKFITHYDCIFGCVWVFFVLLCWRWKMKLDFHQCVEIGEKSVAVLDVVLLLLYFFPLNLEYDEEREKKTHRNCRYIQIHAIFKRDPVSYTFFSPFMHTRTMFEENEMVPRNVTR